MQSAHMIGGARKCPKCGAELSETILGGQCPACMVQVVRQTSAAGRDPPEPSPVLRNPPTSPDPVTLRYFGDYELLSEVGRGGMGVVYRTRQLSLNRVVALKVIAPEHLASPKAVERFHTEAEAAARLDHPNIVPIYETGEHEGRHYFSMKLIEGQSLALGMADFRLPIADVKSKSGAALGSKSQIAKRQSQIAHLLAQVADAVHYAHQRGILHRDLKPGNILLDAARGAYVSDFGLAKLVEGDSSLTLSGEVLGTPTYMAPEQAAGRASQITVAADVYSLGVILYELLTGRPPFAGATPLETLHAVLHEKLRSPHSFNRAVARDLGTICLKCLEREPDRRYPSAHEFAEDLRRFACGEPIQARAATKPEKVWRWCLRKPALATTLLVLQIVLAFGLLGVLWQWRRAEANAIASRQNELVARENLYAADINLAQHALEADNLRQARNLLEKQRPKVGEPDLRGFEWRYLWRQCQGEELFGLPKHEGRVRAVAVSPDGRTVATGGDDRLVKLWDVAAHGAIATLTNPISGPRGRVFSVSFSPGGDLLAAASRASVILWDARTYRQVRTLPGAMLKARFSPDGRYLVTGSTNGLIIWDTLAYRPKKTLELGALWPRAYDSLDSVEFGLDFLPDGSGIGVASNDGIKLLTVPDLHELATLKDAIPRIRFVTFSPDRRFLAACTGTEKDVKVWKMDGHGEPKLLSGHSDSVYAAAFSPDGKRLASCSADQTLKLWDVTNGSLLHTFRGHVEEIWDVTFTPDGNSLVSVSKDGMVKLWDSSRIVTAHPGVDSMRALGFNAQGDLVAFETNNALITFNPETLQRTGTGEVLRHGRRMDNYFGKLLRDGRMLSVHQESRLDLWDLSDGHFIAGVKSVDSHPAYAPKRRLLATATPNDTVSLWQLPQGVRRFVLTNSISPVAFCADEALLATALADSGGVKLWRLGESKLRELGSIGVTVEWVDGLTFSADGRMLAMGEWDGSIGVWTVPSGRRIATLIGHKRSGFMLCFSPDGRTLASVSDDRMVRLWYVARERELMRFELPGRPKGPSLLEFSQDGQALVYSEAFFTRVWHAPALAQLGPLRR